MSTLPFGPDDPLGYLLKRDYLLPALEWLGEFSDPASQYLLPIGTGNLGLTGYTVICILESRLRFLKTSEFVGRFEDKLTIAIEYLISKAAFGHTTCNWDKVTWDTAVVTRALLRYHEANLDRAANGDLLSVIEKALRWLCGELAAWQSTTYTFGTTDFAQILRTFVYAREHVPQIMERLQGEFRSFFGHEDIVGALVDQIMRRVDIESVAVENAVEKVAIWDGNLLTTADIVISLVQYLQCPSSSPDQIVRKNITDKIRLSLRYFEIEQRDGHWRTEETTARTVRAYLLGYSLWDSEVEPEHHIIFKALRWLCDNKIRFSDGSILHDLAPTIYFVLALTETLNNWRPNNLLEERPAFELYDFVIWSISTEPTIERGLRIQAESEVSECRDQLVETRKLFTALQLQLRRWQVSFFVGFWVFLGLVLGIVSGTIVFKTIAIQEIVSPAISITSWEILTAIIGVWLALGGGMYGLLFRQRLGEAQ